MKLDRLFKRSLTALVVSTTIYSANMSAASIEVTGQIKGRVPTLEAVAATGELKVGKELILPDNYVTSFTDATKAVKDLDKDVPLSLKALNDLALTPGDNVGLENAKIEWFIVPDTYADVTGDEKDKWLTPAQFNAIPNEVKSEIKFFDGEQLPQDFTGMQKITIPAVAIGKRIGFKVSVRTETGFPVDGEPRYIMNAFIKKGGENGPGPTDPNPDPKTPPGTVDIEALVIIETRNPSQSSIGDWVTVVDQVEPTNNMTAEQIAEISRVGQQFRARIVDKDGYSLDHLYQTTEAFNWQFIAKPGMTYNGKILTQEMIDSDEFKTALAIKNNGYELNKEGAGTGDFFYFTIQETNDESKIKPLLEQGLILTVNTDDTKVDTSKENPDKTAPFTTPVDTE